MKRILGVLLTIAMLIGIFPTASFATGTNTQQNETVTYSIFDAIIPFSNMVDCQRTTYTAVGEMQQLSGFDYVYSANEDRQISSLVSDVVENPDDYYYRFSEEVDGGITLTMYKYGNSTYSYVLSQNGYMQTYGDNCFLYVADGYGTFVSFRDKEYHMCGNHTHAENYPHEEVNSLDSYRKECILCGCGETFIIKGYEPSIAELKALPIVEGLVEIDHTHGYDETGKCPCGKYDNTTEIDKTDAGIYSDVVVDGLADALEDNLLEDSSVSVLLKVSENTSATAEKDAITQIANGQEIDFIELSLLKSVNGGALQDIGSQNDNLLKIKIPFDATGKQNIAVYRYHGSAAEKLSTTANADGEYFEVVAGYIIIYAKKFSTYAIGYTVESSSGTHANHCVCGTTHTSIGNHTTEENPTWVAISSAEDFDENKDSGYYYLTDDIEVSAGWAFSQESDIVLCLNGYDITYTGSSNVSFIPGSTALNFTLTDCKAEAGSISGFKNTYGGAINVKKTFTMYNGKITGNTATYGGGVYVDQNATFYMYGGKITGNTAKTVAGGVHINAGDIEIAGNPVIKDNSNTSSGGSYFPSKMYPYAKNLYLNRSVITVGNGGLTEGTVIDVTPLILAGSNEIPAETITVANACPDDYSDYFTYSSFFEYKKEYNGDDKTVVLKLQPSCTVTFNMMGHGTQIEPVKLLYGRELILPSAPADNGYEFKYWYLYPEMDDWPWDPAYDSKITKDTTLYAKWVEKPSQSAPETPAAENETIRGKNDGKITGVTEAMEYKKQGEEGYTAITGTEITGLSAGTYLVRFKETETLLASPDKELIIAEGKLITVTFDANGGTVDTQTATTETDGKLASLPTPTRSGNYRFNGWFTATSGGTEVTTDTVFTGDSTIYAQWTYTGSSGGGSSYYNVTFNTNGGSKLTSQRVRRNAFATEPAEPTKDGFEFEGWYTDKEFKNAYDFATKVTKNFTLYAKWEKLGEEKKENSDTHTCPSEKFDDLDTSLWYHLAIDYVLEKGLMKGIDEKTFAPDETLTRAMLVTILYRYEGEVATNRSIPFSDVDMGAYYASAVFWAKQNGIVYGVTENEFAPDEAVTREQLAAILYRYSAFKGDLVSAYENTDISHYADANAVSSYAKTAMQYAVGSNLIRGTSEYTLSPQENTTRAEISAVLERVAGRLH